MKYTKEYCKKNNIVVHLEGKFHLAKEVDKYMEIDHSYLYKGNNYGDETCINAFDLCHCSKTFYESRSEYTIVGIHEFLADIKKFNYVLY